MNLLDKFKKKENKKAKPEVPAKVKVDTAPALKPVKAEKFIPKPNKEDTGNAYKVLLRPLITEKVTALGAENKYVFAVAGRTNKNEVKKAIRSLYGVMPIKINIITSRGSRVAAGRHFRRQADWKKAIVTLKPGETIQVYEGV